MNNAFYKSYFVYTNIYGKDKAINEKLLFNKFYIDLMYTCRLFADNHKIEKVILCYDSKENFRKKLYANYKSNRSKKEESFYNVLNYTKEYFKKQGFIVSQVDQLEADDLIGVWVNHLGDETNCILSADEDCRQLLNANTFIYNNNSRDKRYYYIYDSLVEPILNAKHIFVNPDFILFSKMILGCEGDMVPKLLRGRIGEKTLKKKIFDKIQFNKQEVTDEDLVDIDIRLNSTFKGEDVIIKELEQNLMLVNLCTDCYHSEAIKQETKKHLEEAKFTYNENYKVI